MPLEKQTITVPFIGGIDQHTAQELMAPGSFVTVINGEYVKRGRVRKRPGLALVSSTGLPTMERFALFEDRLLAFDDSTGGDLYEYYDVGNQFVQRDRASPCVVRRRGIARDMTSDVSDGDVEVAGGYILHTWEKFEQVALGSEIWLRISELATGGTVVLTQAQLETGTVGVPRRPRMAANDAGTAVLLTYIKNVLGVPTLIARRIDLTTTPPTVGMEVTLVATTVAFHYDLTGGLSGGRWAVTYVDGAADWNMLEVTAVPAAGALATFVGSYGGGLAIRRIGANVFAMAWETFATEVRYAVRNEATWVAVLGPTLIALGIEVTNMTITPHTNGADGVLMYSLGSSVVDPISAQTRWTSGTPAGVLTPLVPNTQFRCELQSKAWTRDGGYWAWSSTNSDRLVQHGLALCEFPLLAGARARPVACSGLGTIGQLSNDLHRVSNVAIMPSGTEYLTMVDTRLEVTSRPSVGTIQGQDELTADFAHRSRGQSVQFAGLTYLSGGIIMQYDGERLSENAVVQSPSIRAGVVGAGALNAGTYSWVAIWEFFDQRGNRMRSVRSNVVSVTFGAPGSSQQILFMPNTLTTRQEVTTLTTASMVLGLYRTVANGTVFFRVITLSEGVATPTLDNNAAAVAELAFVDNLIDSSIQDNEVLYTEGGAIDNDTVWGGTAFIFATPTRLWACDGEDGEVVWFSKEIVEGEPAQFSIGLQIRIAGERITCGAALDTGVVALFSEDAIYLVRGEGPNDTGNPQTGVFSTPEPITVDAGCIAPRSIVETPMGIMFQSRRGMYLLTQARELQYLGIDVEDLLASFPTVRWSVLQAERGLVHWGIATSEGELHAVITYDYVEKKWARRIYVGGVEMRDAIMYDSTLTLGRINGSVYQETLGAYLDDGVWYGLILDTGWLNFGSQQGFKRLWRYSLLTERLSAYALRLRHAYAPPGVGETYGAFVAADNIDLTAAETLAAGGQLRVHVRRQKGEAWRFEIEEVNPGAGAGQGFEAIGLAFEVGVLPGVQRLPAGASR